MSMEVSKRNRIALVVFVLLLLGLVAVVGLYISQVGRSLNNAASTIDDAAGELTDYTAIVYAGTVTSKATDADSADAASKELNERAQQDVDMGEKTAAEALSESADSDQAQQGETSEQADEDEPPTVDAVRRQYQEKGAAVIELDVASASAYSSRTVICTPKHSFGILRIDADSDSEAVAERIDEYELAEVDFVVAITTDLSLVEEIEGLDIVVSVVDEGLLSQGVTVDGVFYDDAVLTSEVGTVLVSPSKGITARDVDSL